MTTTDNTTNLLEAIDELIVTEFGHHISIIKLELQRLLEVALTTQAKAYGGCTNCYGKGYATVAKMWHGYDTDQDIGSPGGYISGGDPFTIKLCTCDRGKQLEKFIAAQDVKSRLDENDIWLAHSTSRRLNDSEPAIRSIDFHDRIGELKATQLPRKDLTRSTTDNFHVEGGSEGWV